MPSLPHALVNCEEFKTSEDYISRFKNIRKKIKTFSKKGGEYIRINNKLDEKLIPSLKKCFISTANKSVFYLPYQELYLKSALKTSSINISNATYFVAFLNGEFLGYQAAIRTGSHLNALHGAFDRSLKTTYHAYDILFVKMTEFAIENNIKSIDFGAVLNYTKQKMVNRIIEMSYFIYSKYRILQIIFSIFLKFTKIQGKDQMKFRN